MIIKISLYDKEYLKDLAIFLKFRMDSTCPVRIIGGPDFEQNEFPGEITEFEYEDAKKEYQDLIHMDKPEQKEKWRMERLVNQAWEQYVNLYSEGKEREYLLKYFHCSIVNFIDGHKEDGECFYFIPESQSSKILLM